MVEKENKLSCLCLNAKASKCKTKKRKEKNRKRRKWSDVSEVWSLHMFNINKFAAKLYKVGNSFALLLLFFFCVYRAFVVSITYCDESNKKCLAEETTFKGSVLDGLWLTQFFFSCLFSISCYYWK